MAESYSKSKLKRKKSSVEDVHVEIPSRGAVKRSHTTVLSSDMTVKSGRSAWWNREQLPAVEGLWALSLRSAVPYLENQHWDLVPDLPHPSAARPTALMIHEQRWCDLSEEVADLPEPSPPSLRTSSSPDPLRLSSFQQTKPVPASPDRQSSTHSRQSHNSKTPSLQDLSKPSQPSLHSWEESTASAGPTSVRGEDGRRGGERDQETRAVNIELLTNQVRATDSQVSLHKGAENEEEVVEDEEVQGNVKGDAGGGGGASALQSCPLCLLVFPVGFTQMDCDGHLAQCLSEVNVDVTW